MMMTGELEHDDRRGETAAAQIKSSAIRAEAEPEIGNERQGTVRCGNDQVSVAEGRREIIL